MIKQIFIGVIVLLSASGAVAQEQKIDKRLEKKYSVEELKKIQKENPQQLEYLNFVVEKGFTIMPYPKSKGTPKEISGEVEIKDLKNINIYDLGLDVLKDNWQYYKIKGTDDLLVIYSEDYIKEYLINK